MKKIIFVFFVGLMLASCGNYLDSGADGYRSDVVYQREEVNFNQFYSTLSPFGSWMTYPGLGQVWIADDPFFKPYYTNGRWAYSRYGWTWVSNYSWGWAPFHYGRWAYDSFYGWMWVPGYTWGPAWVNWRNYNGYYAWSPAMAGSAPSSTEHWVVVDGKNLDAPQLSDFVLTDQRALDVIRNGSQLSATQKGLISGPPPSAIREAGRLKRVDVMKVDEVPVPSFTDKSGLIKRTPELKRVEMDRRPIPDRNIRRPSNAPVLQPEIRREVPMRELPQRPVMQPVPQSGSSSPLEKQRQPVMRTPL